MTAQNNALGPMPKYFNAYLNELDLINRDTDWPDILASRNWSFLRSLSLHKCMVDGSNVRNIVEAGLGNLEFLKLGHNEIGCKEIKELLSKQWPKLKQLNLFNNNIGDNGLHLLLKTQNLPCLLHLYIGHNNLTSTGLKPLPQSPFHNLTQLKLNYNWIGYQGVKYIVRGRFVRLRELWVMKCGIGGEGFRGLAKGMWPDLREIYITYNLVEIDGYLGLAFSDFRKLEEINKVWIEQIEPIQLLGLVATVWPRKTSINCQIKNKKFRILMPRTMKQRFYSDQ